MPRPPARKLPLLRPASLRNLLVSLLAIAFPGMLAGTSAFALPPAAKHLLHLRRQSDSDLEITGLIRNLQPGESSFVRYADLLALPQTRAVVTDHPGYPGPPLHISGVSFETLSAALGALPQSDLIDALCTDRYRAHFPAPYIAQHHPILVLTVDGQTLAAWARQAHQLDPGPYVVMYARFVPSFKLLAHVDRPQLPDNVVRLNFSTQAATFGAIAPHGSFPPGSPEQIGFAIAKQNCLRCHFQGPFGGTKSGQSWQSLSLWAREQPAYFQAYVSNPQKIDPHAHMEPNPEYDNATLSALTAYFRTFTPSVTPPAREAHSR